MEINNQLNLIYNFYVSELSCDTAFKLLISVPPPQLVIDVGIVPIYESTRFTLTCTMSLPSAVDVHTILRQAHWTNSNGQIINTSNRIMTNTNDHITTLTFSPIDNGDHSQYNDTGEYTCHFNVLLQDPIVVSSQNKTSVYIEVLGN